MTSSRWRYGLAVAAAAALVTSACDNFASSSTTVGTAGTGTTVAAAPTSAAASNLPDSIKAIMTKPRYKDATWSLLVTDVKSGESFYPLNDQQLSYTGSTRKLFSVGLALDTLGADARQTTPVYRRGNVSGGTLDGDLVLVGGGDLTFGGRRIDDDTVAVTDFDHNDANGLGGAILTPQDPLYAVDQLAAQVKASGITAVNGDVVVDARMFQEYRVPNGNLLITPMLLNENMVDVAITPTQPGQPADVTYRPLTAAFEVVPSVTTGATGTDADVEFSNDNLIQCLGQAGCKGTVSGTIPQGYVGPLTKTSSLVGTFRVEDPSTFARTAFIEALQRNGVTVKASPVAPNPAGTLPTDSTYPADTKVASYQSPPFAQNSKLVLKVSLNLGANLDLSLFGLTKDQRTVQGSLAAERKELIDQFGINGDQFLFPTNGSGTPDSQAAPQALVTLLTQMSKTPVAAPYQASLPIMGVDGSLATTGTSLPGKGHVFAKPGTTVMPGPDGRTPELKAQNLAGYIQTKSGRTVAYALMVNNAGPVVSIGKDVGEVFEDEGTISSLIYEML